MKSGSVSPMASVGDAAMRTRTLWRRIELMIDLLVDAEPLVVEPSNTGVQFGRDVLGRNSPRSRSDRSIE